MRIFIFALSCGRATLSSMHGKQEQRILTKQSPERIEQFRAIYLAHYQALYMKAYLILKNPAIAEDIVQDLFAKLWQSGSFIEHVSKMAPYLHQAVKNACLDHLRKEIRHQSAVSNIHPQTSTELFDSITSKESIENLTNVLSELPEQCRKIIDLVYIHEKKYKEAADQLNISVNTVKTQLRRGLAKIRERMKPYK